MYKLSRDQLDHVAHYVQQSNPHQALQAELLDHLASQIERQMAQGHDFPTAFGQVMQQASPQAISQLKQTYSQELTGQLVPMARVGLRTKRRPAAEPFKYILFSSALMCPLLLIFLTVVSRPFAVPFRAFQPTWVAALLGLLSVLVVRWWLTRRRRKPRLARPA